MFLSGNYVDGLEIKIADLQAENADLRRQLDAVPRDDIDDLYTAYAYATAGSEAHARFPAVGRWLGKLPEVQP